MRRPNSPSRVEIMSLLRRDTQSSVVISSAQREIFPIPPPVRQERFLTPFEMRREVLFTSDGQHKMTRYDKFHLDDEQEHYRN